MPSHDTPSRLFRERLGHAPTPLIDLPQAARRTSVARVHLKDESRRWLGSFKSLGGTHAALQALVRAVGAAGIDGLLQRKGDPPPRLLCASDGNHGLAVAAGARLAGAPARVYLPSHVPPERARRIADQGAEIRRVEGTYDDAVDEATRAAGRGEGLLIADTSSDPDDPVVADVMDGYGLAAQEVLQQLRERDQPPPTHVFVQAGVGGLAAAMTRGLAGCRTVVVEPERVACVGLALRLGRIERLAGDLRTSAEMLSCGEASAPAIRILVEHRAEAMTVSEDVLLRTPALLASLGGPSSTPSGTAGAAGFLSLDPGPVRARRFGLDESSRVLLIVTEGPVPPDGSEPD